jgi:transcriptional/translational regulatory protein YebC/TACO1
MPGPNSPGVIERALQVAAESQSLNEVEHKLKQEGYEFVEQHLRGRVIRKQIIERLMPSDKKRPTRF